mgnify:CR=1 FL=1
MISDAIYNAKREEVFECIEILRKDYRELKTVNHEMSKGIHLAILKLQSKVELMK